MLHWQLVLVLDGPHPRTAGRHPTAAERPDPILVAVTLRLSIRLPLALRADDLVDLPAPDRPHDRVDQVPTPNGPTDGALRRCRTEYRA